MSGDEGFKVVNTDDFITDITDFNTEDNSEDVSVVDSSESDSKIQKKRFSIKEIFEWADTIVIALVSVVIIFTFFFRIATIVGESMENTFYEGERVVISNLFYEPQYGDVVVISRNADNSVKDNPSGSEPIIKRIIATEGQYVDIDFESGKVYVGPDLSNMKELDEPYTKTPTNRRGENEFPMLVKEGYVFVLGDNRNESLDSRYASIGEDGLIDEKYILGRVVLRIWPFDKIGGVD